MLEVLKIFFSSIFMMISVHAFGFITTSKEQRKPIKLVSVLILLLFAGLHTIINIYLDGSIKTLIICILYTTYIYIAIEKNLIKSIFSSNVYVLLIIIPDLIILGVITKILNMSKEYCYSTFAGSILGNLSVSALMILLVYLLRKPLRKIVNYKLSSSTKIIIVSLLALVTIAKVFYNLITDYRFSNDVLTYVLLIGTLMIILFSLLRQRSDTENMFRKNDALIGIMKNYEIDIEDQRTLNHETKNELLTIRSKLSDEEDKELCEYIDSIIGDKKVIKSSKISKFRYLPDNGLRSFFYYKVIEAEEKGVRVEVNIAKKVENSFLGNLKTKDFRDLTRIIGVYLDNAIEASSTSEKKQLGIEIYLFKETIEIIISNTYNNKIDEYNELAEQTNAKVKELTPTYVEGNWIKTTDGSFAVDSSKFSNKRGFAIWAKLVSSDGTISYDEVICSVNGTKKDDVKVKGISVDKTALTLEKGSSYTLKTTITPENATNQSVTWTSDNKDVATVSGGKITAIAKGTATITATTADGNYTATCKVTVNEENNASEQKTLEEIEVKLEKNKDFSFIGYVGHKLNKKGLVVTVTYSDGTTKDITTGYTISPDEKFAKADDGKMKVLKVSYTENGVTKTCEINVKVIEDSTIKDDDDLPDTGAIVVASIITIACLATAIGYLGYKKYKQI